MYIVPGWKRRTISFFFQIFTITSPCISAFSFCRKLYFPTSAHQVSTSRSVWFSCWEAWHQCHKRSHLPVSWGCFFHHFMNQKAQSISMLDARTGSLYCPGTGGMIKMGERDGEWHLSQEWQRDPNGRKEAQSRVSRAQVVGESWEQNKTIKKVGQSGFSNTAPLTLPLSPKDCRKSMNFLPWISPL